MNAPERSTSWRLDDDEKKVEYQPDTKVPHAGSFVINKEDHTLANLLRMQLLQDKQVRFAGYMHPHPLENKMVLKVQTTGDTGPHDVLANAIEDLRSEADGLVETFAQQVASFKRVNDPHANIYGN